MSQALCTSSWRALWEADKARVLNVQPVRISLGVPKFWKDARDFPYLPDLAPDPWMLGMQRKEFSRLYLAKLERIGFDRIHDQLTALRQECGGQTLALACFEHGLKYIDCHRTTFRSRFWLVQTGETIEEWFAPEGNQLTLEVDR